MLSNSQALQRYNKEMKREQRKLKNYELLIVDSEYFRIFALSKS
jgi:hypothetical protein